MKTKQVLMIMKVISWIIFIGLCIKAGTLIISSSVSLFVNPEAAKDLYLGLNLFTLYEFDMGHYIGIVLLLILLATLKAFIFYLVIKIFLKFDLKQPFTNCRANLISKISYVCLFTGMLSMVANKYDVWLITHRIGTHIPLDFGNEGLLFMSGILFIVAYIFKYGVEIQSENDLTV
ncbi:DUF2975 domain-containing protein [Yeosuana sp. AK3]